MMTARVTAEREAVLRLAVQGPGGQQQDIDAVIDTGFNGYLTLPRAAVAALCLPCQGQADAELGDGSVVLLRRHNATVRWHDEAREVRVLEAEGVSCVGMGLLFGSRMSLDIIEGGLVTIEPMAS